MQFRKHSITAITFLCNRGRWMLSWNQRQFPAHCKQHEQRFRLCSTPCTRSSRRRTRTMIRVLACCVHDETNCHQTFWNERSSARSLQGNVYLSPHSILIAVVVSASSDLPLSFSSTVVSSPVDSEATKLSSSLQSDSTMIMCYI